MSEHLAQMAPMLILAGLAAGWLSEAVAHRGGYGLLHDMALGIAGSVVAGTATTLLSSTDIGMIANLLLGLIGGFAVITVQRSVWRSERSWA